MFSAVEAERIDSDDMDIKPIKIDLVQPGESFNTNAESCRRVFRRIEKDRAR